MTDTLMALPRPFHTTVNLNEDGANPLFDQPFHWKSTRDGNALADYYGQLTAFDLWAAFCACTYDEQGGAVWGSSRWNTAEAIQAEFECFYDVNWDGTRLVCKLSPIDGWKADWEGWNWELVFTPIVNPELVKLLSKVNYNHSAPPLLARFNRMRPRAAALAYVMIRNISNYRDYELDELLDPRYTQVAETLNEAELETILTLGVRWTGTLEELANAARNI